MSLANELEKLAGEATPGPWETRDHVISPEHGLDRVKLLTVQHGPLGSIDRPDAALIVALRNNLDTILSALREREARETGTFYIHAHSVESHDWPFHDEAGEHMKGEG